MTILENSPYYLVVLVGDEAYYFDKEHERWFRDCRVELEYSSFGWYYSIVP